MSIGILADKRRACTKLASSADGDSKRAKYWAFVERHDRLQAGKSANGGCAVLRLRE